MRPVIVTTEYRGVFFGYADATESDEIQLYRARMAISFGTTRGLFQLAETGPTKLSSISAQAPSIHLRKVTAVIELTDKAVAAWEAHGDLAD